MQITDHVTSAAEAIAAAQRVVAKRQAAMHRPKAAKSAAGRPVKRDWLFIATAPVKSPERLAQRRVTYAECLAVVCEELHITEADITSPSRVNAIKYRRQVLAWLARRYTRLSFPQLGQRMNRDHSTLVHAFAVVDAATEDDPRHALARQAEAALVARFGGGVGGNLEHGQ